MEQFEHETAPSSLLSALRNRLGLNTTPVQNNVPLASLQTAFEDADWHTRVEAVMAASEHPEHVSIEMLLQALHDEDVSVRAAAVYALGKRSEDVPVAQLLEALHDSEWLVREATVLTLGEPGERVPEEQLMAMLDDDNMFVRDAAMGVLQQTHAESSSSILPGSPVATQMPEYQDDKQGRLREQPVQAYPTKLTNLSKGLSGSDLVNKDNHRQEGDIVSTSDSGKAEIQRHPSQKPLVHIAPKRRLLQRIVEGVLVAVLIGGLLVSWLVLAQRLHPSTAHNGNVSTTGHFKVSTVPTVIPRAISGKGAIAFTYHSQGGLEYPTWSSDGKHLLFVSDVGDGQHGGGSVYSWDVTTKKLTKTFTLPALSNATGGYAWSPDGTRIILASYNGKLQLFNAFTGQRILSAESPSAFQDWPNFSWSPDNRYLALTGADGTLQIWDANTGKRLSAFPEHLSDVYWISWSPDGQHIVTIIKYGLVQVWDATTGKKVSTINDQALIDVQWSANGQYLVSRNNDGSLTTWDALTGHKISSYTGGDALWMCNNTRLLSPNTHVIDVWDAATGKTAFTLPEPPAVDASIFANYIQPSRWALSPDCKLMALGSGYTKVQVLDATSGHLLSTLQSAATIEGVSWSSDGRYVSATTNDKSMLIWNALTGNTMNTYHIASNSVYSVGWSPDDSFIFTVSVDHILQVVQTT
jgi:WD40 repeat protein